METDTGRIAQALLVGSRLLMRQTRHLQAEDDLSTPETSALARLEHSGPTTSSALARLEGISPQSMGATLGALEARGLVARRPDPGDGRRAILSLTEAGRQVLRGRRNVRIERLAAVLADGFTPEEQEALATAAPLIERLAQNI